MTLQTRLGYGIWNKLGALSPVPGPCESTRSFIIKYLDPKEPTFLRTYMNNIIIRDPKKGGFKGIR